MEWIKYNRISTSPDVKEGRGKSFLFVCLLLFEVVFYGHCSNVDACCFASLFFSFCGTFLGGGGLLSKVILVQYLPCVWIQYHRVGGILILKKIFPKINIEMQPACNN